MDSARDWPRSCGQKYRAKAMPQAMKLNTMLIPTTRAETLSSSTFNFLYNQTLSGQVPRRQLEANSGCIRCCGAIS
jgi:hypothetical protein